MDPDNHSWEEKREYPRRGVLAFARVLQVDRSANYSGKIFNISPKGMYVETDAPLDTGDVFHVQVVQSEELPEGNTYRCAVIWHHTTNDFDTGLFGYGAQFI